MKGSHICFWNVFMGKLKFQPYFVKSEVTLEYTLYISVESTAGIEDGYWKYPVPFQYPVVFIILNVCYYRQVLKLKVFLFLALILHIHIKREWLNCDAMSTLKIIFSFFWKMYSRSIEFFVISFYLLVILKPFKDFQNDSISVFC